MNHLQFPKPLKQIHVGRGLNGYEDVSAAETDETYYKREHETLKDELMRLCPPPLWPSESYKAYCPRPILINGHHQSVLQELNDALVASVTDIVNRWWLDADAHFPKRMPLGEKEQDLLKYVGLQSVIGHLPPYEVCRGSWRPDFMIEEVKLPDGVLVENFRITEINARFSFNGFMHATYGHMALESTGMGSHGFVSAASPKEIVDGLFNLFRRDRPVHLLKGEEPGMDIHMFVDEFKRRMGYAPRIISPADLRLVPDLRVRSGYRLFAAFKKPERGNALPDVSTFAFTSGGEVVEEVYQVGLELHQRELLAMSPEVLREVGLRCFNDLRTILLVHDKRMLGIIKQELKKQVFLGIITEKQELILDRSIADTYLPQSIELGHLLVHSAAHPEVRQDYILKPIRSGKGDGIKFGDSITDEEWMAALKLQLSPNLELDRCCVIQRRIIPRLYDVVLKASGERVRYPLIGTFMVIHGVLLGLALWRSSDDRICAISHGGAWLCSVIRKD
ncbi:hypothetical protein THARTR1_09004 [Trichoderma harzianum]|uniref:Taurine catabolism dioxygenase TauD n=1 Tax=Trichoderma harzianum TaxID=5544 RepID=A0A2K0TXS7_TRIHA|nr:hypothetical protein THARTR1_09004 [Trichoderma harzianum]